MNEVDAKQQHEAYHLWRFNHYAYPKHDERIVPFLSEQMHETQGGWLRAAREALFLSTSEVAQRLKISRSAYSKIERNEIKGCVSISTLARAARALDCELVYAIRPKEKIRFSQIIWQKILPEAIVHIFVKSRQPIFKGRALAYIASVLMRKPTFRRRQRWTER